MSGIMIRCTDFNLLQSIIDIENFDRLFSYKPAKGARKRGFLWLLLLISIYQEELIDQLRINHGQLRLISASISDSCGIRISSFLLSMINEAILNLYDPAKFPIKSILSMLFYSACDLFMLFVLLTASNRLMEKSKHILTLFSQIPVSKVTQSCQIQIELFMTQTYVKHIQISAKGFFTLDRPLLISVVMTWATYFILCVQLKEEINIVLKQIASFLRITIIPLLPFQF
ncbi:uncharacterized protein LOC142318524 [Lycorma delicatula]|uniref:uncharacterized protein LOC142318524 n=1 Tax=Lycorma delicatula TaxID=130591 RepID=UPI003F518C2D